LFGAPPQWLPSLAFDRVFTLVFLGWFAVELINQLIGRRRGGAGHVEDRGSYWGIIVAVYVAIGSAYAARFLGWGVLRGLPQYLGLALMLVGIAEREWAIVVLGRSFAVRVTIQTDHQLITRGPYRWLRHPAYTGSILTLIGLPLALGTWVGALLAAAVSLLAYMYRAQVEEQALITAFGNEYRDYMRHTWRFFPGW
jgi:protein-S-isoprenylcysteine O-methyltransferase Ste14